MPITVGPDAKDSTGSEQNDKQDDLVEEYSYPDSDITLKSSDGRHFNIHALVLKLASDVFAGMVAIPRSPEDRSEPVQLDEKADVIRALLDFVYPRRPPPTLLSFEFASRVAEAADKYDIVDATNYLRSVMSRTLSLFPGGALEQYALACRFGWVEEARCVSRYTTLPNTRDPAQRRTLESMDITSVIKLLDLHQGRSSCISSLSVIWDRVYRNGIYPKKYIAVQHKCRSPKYDDIPWTIFKMSALKALQETSPASCLPRFDNDFWKDRCFATLWDVKCKTCGALLFQKDDFVEEFTEVLRRLPSTID